MLFLKKIVPEESSGNVNVNDEVPGVISTEKEQIEKHDRSELNKEHQVKQKEDNYSTGGEGNCFKFLYSYFLVFLSI